MTRPVALKVLSPWGRSVSYPLDGTQYTVGRAAPKHRPDIALEPDPQGWISRLHCILDYLNGRWWVTDYARNGTLLERESEPGHWQSVLSREPLQHHDTLVILGDLAKDDTKLYWRLTYIDANWTRPAPGSGFEAVEAIAAIEPVETTRARAAVRYDWVASRLYRVEGSREVPVSGLLPKGHQLLRYMVGRARDLCSAEVACDHAELIAALWGAGESWSGGSSYNRSDLAGVVYRVRKCIEADPARPVILETVPTFGYRLSVSPEAAEPAAGSAAGCAGGPAGGDGVR
jgi:DNA-binding winged helix-turn-helix (wHTH) protein